MTGDLVINLCPVSKLLSVLEISEPPSEVANLITYPRLEEKSSLGALPR